LKRTLGKSDRIARRADLTRVFRNGRSAADAAMRLRVCANDLGRSRMAVVVSTRHGPAVRRNRIKRLAREAFRACRDQLPGGYDYVLQPAIGAETSLAGLISSLRALAGRLIRRRTRE